MLTIQNVNNGRTPLALLDKPEYEIGSDIKEIVTLTKNGEKLKAIRLYRDLFGVRLVDAKNAIEAIAKIMMPEYEFMVSRVANASDTYVAHSCVVVASSVEEANRKYRERFGLPNRDYHLRIYVKPTETF